MPDNSNAFTRRDFLTKMGALAIPGMLALDLLKAAPVHALPSSGSGKGKKVIILGAGIAGMTAAYELARFGYACTILEARSRSGGRAFSVRNGDTNEEKVNGRQKAVFDDGLYFNAGPSRIPHHHTLTLHYCKELGVPLEVYNNINEATYYFSEGKGPLSNKKIRKREIHNDMRGYMAEWLAKAVNADALDAALSKEDTEKFLEYIRAEGALNIDNLYKGSTRRGYVELPGAGERPGTTGNPYDLKDIIQSGLTGTDFYNVAEYVFELQQTMLQVVGGNDKIAKALEQKVKPMIRMQAVVQDIQNKSDTVSIKYKDADGVHELEGDYCICTIPMPVLSDIDHNFSSNVSRAIDKTVYIKTGKMALQFKRRFWEEDEMIYGGITHTNNELYQLFYPSNNYLARKGLLIGYYNFNDRAAAMSALNYADREKLALAKGRLIHPQYDQEYEGKSFSISWDKTSYSLGGWGIYSAAERQTNYKALLAGDKRVYFAGEHLSYLNGWMAGAFESARAVITALHNRETGQQFPYPKQD